ncbi:hypothetical protein CEXT_618101 [Caerostris extrusa]|uniref:Uncharacterized protein n=1 Tax=Caerostris extrusa TaxID=172846 RepID=A0AAV4T8X8_CAEEX|nr:hypothetical protein CEXT_618101 [Caerostris extrusa]
MIQGPIDPLALCIGDRKSVNDPKVVTLECALRKCTLLKYFLSFLIFGSFSNVQNIYLHPPSIALNFRTATQSERSPNYANEYLSHFRTWLAIVHFVSKLQCDPGKKAGGQALLQKGIIRRWIGICREFYFHKYFGYCEK